MNQDNPLYVLFRVYDTVMSQIDPNRILLSVQQDLCGLKQCALHGVNEDKVPPQNIANYYEWSSYKRLSAILSGKTWTPERFREVAMKNYIATAHRYLCRLKLLRPGPHKIGARAGVLLDLGGTTKDDKKESSLSL